MSHATAVLLLDDARPINIAALRTWPRVGIEITGLVLNPRHNLAEIVRIYQDCGVTLTRVNLLATGWMNPANTMPFRWPGGALGDHRWNLFDWNPQYFDRLQDVQERMNAAGIVVEWCFLELYSWSRRKHVDVTFSPWRYNVNDVLWGGDLSKAGDDETLRVILPDEWCRAFLERAVPLCRLDPNVLLIGNEFPEKSLHVRVRDMVLAIEPMALVSVNRNEETPGQYTNMKIGRDFDFLELHGVGSMDEIRRTWSPSQSSIESFEALLTDPDVDTSRIIFNSDGCRVSDDATDPYDWDRLGDVARYVRSRGCSFLHQSRAKLSEEPNHHMIETEWFRSLLP